MQQPETNALEGLLKMGDESGVDLRRLLPTLGRRMVPAGPKRGKLSGGEVDLTALQFPEGLFKNADGTQSTIHREWAMAKSGLFLAPPCDFEKIMEGKVVVCKDEHSFLSTAKLVVCLSSRKRS